MTIPPRTPELLLETLGADVALRDAVVGDLAEEYAWIADAVDERTARRWYWREALRAVPLLAGSAVRRLTWSDVQRRAGIALSAYIFTLVLSLVVGITVNVLAVRAIGAETLATPAGLWGLLGVQLVQATWSSVLAGYLAAWLDDDAPLTSALTLAALWCLWYLAVGVVAGGPTAVRQIVLGVIAIVGMTGGGLLRLRQLARAAHVS